MKILITVKTQCLIENTVTKLHFLDYVLEKRIKVNTFVIENHVTW